LIPNDGKIDGGITNRLLYHRGYFGVVSTVASRGKSCTRQFAILDLLLAAHDASLPALQFVSDLSLWYQLGQLRLENTSLDHTTLNNDFAAISWKHSTSEGNTSTYENP
jgi:hypothetical protein